MEARIAALVHLISDGDQSEYVRKMLVDLEAQSRHEKAAIAEIRDGGAKPVPLPSPDLVLRCCERLQEIVENEPVRARESLRLMFGDEGLRVTAPRRMGAALRRERSRPCGSSASTSAQLRKKCRRPRLLARASSERS